MGLPSYNPGCHGLQKQSSDYRRMEDSLTKSLMEKRGQPGKVDQKYTQEINQVLLNKKVYHDRPKQNARDRVLRSWATYVLGHLIG